MAASGTAVLLSSSELTELLNVSTRIIVLRNGSIRGEIAREHATQDAMLRILAGLA